MDESAKTPDRSADIPPDLPDLPDLPPDVEARIRHLLADEPEPGPMPARYADRISAVLAEEARLRVDRGPLAEQEPQPSADERVLAPLVRQRQRRSPLFAAAAVAAAAVVVAVGGSALHLNKRPPDATAAVVNSPRPGGVAESSIHIQLSTTAYDASNLVTRARELITSPGPEIRELSTEAGLGPVATPIGVTTCLDAIPAREREQGVSVDLATYEGRPAAIIVTEGATATVAYVVERTCGVQRPGVIKGATPVP